MPAACRLVWMLVFPRADSSRAEGQVGARALERVVGGSAYDRVALSVAGRTVTTRHELAVEGTRSSPRAAYTIVGGRFVDGAAPREGHIDCGLGQREATAILGWRHSEVLYEKAPHRADVTEPGSRTDVLDWEIGLLEQSPRLVDPDATHEICRRLVEVSAAPAAERARAHSGGIRETLHRQRLVEVLKDERVDVVALGRDPFLAAECGAELRLTSRSSQKQDQHFRNCHGDRVSMICFDKREREVDSRSDARGRPEATLVHEDALVHDLGRRKSRTQFIEKAPMCGRTPTVKYPGFPEDEGARADAYQRRNPSMMLAKPSHEALLGFG